MRVENEPEMSVDEPVIKHDATVYTASAEGKIWASCTCSTGDSLAGDSGTVLVNPCFSGFFCDLFLLPETMGLCVCICVCMSVRLLAGCLKMLQFDSGKTCLADIRCFLLELREDRGVQSFDCKVMPGRHYCRVVKFSTVSTPWTVEVFLGGKPTPAMNLQWCRLNQNGHTHNFYAATVPLSANMPDTVTY